MLCSVHSVFIVPAGTLWLPWLRFFRAFSSVIRQLPGYNSQRRGTFYVLFVLCCSMYCLFCVVLCIVFACYCHRLSTQLQFKKCIYKYWGSYFLLHMDFKMCLLTRNNYLTYVHYAHKMSKPIGLWFLFRLNKFGHKWHHVPTTSTRKSPV
jgi:hypothetical protein